MIRVDQALCDGCGACADDCPSQAIFLDGDAAVVDTDLCNECGVCIGVCPNQALSLIGELVTQVEESPAPSWVQQTPFQVIRIDTKRPVTWRAAMLPAVGSALSWVRREVVPRLGPLALDALQGVVDRRLNWPPGIEDVRSVPKEGGSSRGRQRRHRHRKGHSR